MGPKKGSAENALLEIAKWFHRLSPQEQLEYFWKITHFGVAPNNEHRQKKHFAKKLKEMQDQDANAEFQVTGLLKQVYFIIHRPGRPEAEFIVCGKSIRFFLRIGKKRYEHYVRACLIHLLTDEPLRLNNKGNRTSKWIPAFVKWMEQYEKHQAHYGQRLAMSKSNINPEIARVYIKKPAGAQTVFQFYLLFIKDYDPDHHAYQERQVKWKTWWREGKGGEMPQLAPIVEGTPTFGTWKKTWYTLWNIRYGLKTKDRCSTCVSLHNKIKALTGKKSKKKQLAEALAADDAHTSDYRFRRNNILLLKLGADACWKPKHPRRTQEERLKHAIAN